MSVARSGSGGDKFTAKLAWVTPALCGQLGGFLGAVAVILYLQTPQLATIKQQGKNLSKAVLQQEEAKAQAQLSISKQLPTFGFNNLVADWHFINFMQYFGDNEVRQKAGYASAMEYFDAILNRDPRFLEAYYYLSNAGSIYAGQPERSVALMNRSLKSLSPKVPDRGYFIWRLKAVDELLFLGRVPDARNSMQNAANWAKQYDTEEGQNVARLSQNTANYLSRNPNSKKAQFDAWNMVLKAAIDDFVIKRAIVGIQSTGGKVTIITTGEFKEFKVEAPAKD
jgi:tetratricopeptide (TPR) repeat protein